MNDELLIRMECDYTAVHSGEAVAAILDEYTLGVHADVTKDEGTWQLSFHGYQTWPSALPNQLVPTRDDFESFTAYQDAKAELFRKEGNKHFEQLLLELAPHLARPLVIQATACTSDGGVVAAKRWTVEPNATELDTAEFRPLYTSLEEVLYGDETSSLGSAGSWPAAENGHTSEPRRGQTSDHEGRFSGSEELDDTVTIVKSIAARVRDVAAVQEILDDYWIMPEYRLDSAKGTLSFHATRTWPEAVPIEDIPDKWWDEDEPGTLNDRGQWKIVDLATEVGPEGFVEMLQRLAPHLETPLTVVATDHWKGGEFIAAKQLVVKPNASEVGVTEVRGVSEAKTETEASVV